jgi:excisionase family DNA binding protein
VNQVAERINASKRHVYHLIESGQLAALSLGDKKGYRVPEDVLERFIAERLEGFSRKNGFVA